MILQEEREMVVEYGKKMVELGLTVGTFGNLSVFNPKENLMAISPSGMDYYLTKPEDVVVLTPDGEKVDGDRKPSSEYDMHRIFYQRRPGINAVVHTHSTFATTLACLHWSIEPLHYLIAYSGADVPCIPYVQFGTYELAEAAFNAMGSDHYACLLGNHGLLTCGGTLPYTMDIAQQIEFVSQIYYYARTAGKPVLLSDDDLKVVLGQFQNYRQK
ncbi:MAG: L-fuculose-phosphate aldolase [Clostridiales bacterium]|nr:L-fuculose-phosphate aldolase [Clostridiales bacterium]